MDMTADKATDDVRGLVEALRYRVNNPSAWDDFDQGASDDIAKAAATLTSLLERAERAERRAEELADGLMYVTVDHTGCIYTTADEDRAIKLAKDNLVEAERNARERAEARIKELEQALEPFAKIADDGAMIGAADKDEDVWFRLDGSVLKVGDFRRARAVKGE